MRTLCVDIGGSGIKAIVVDLVGNPLSERIRLETPSPALPAAVLEVLAEVIRRIALMSGYERVSVGFPGVVMDGIAKTAPNLDPSWAGFAMAAAVEKLTDKPVRMANDADIQGLAVIEGRGLEMLITFGTGLGGALYIDGHCVPNLELGHHPWKKGATYEERTSNAVRKRIGKKRWNKRVRDVIAQLEPIFNYRKLYVGGGNAKHIEPEGLPANVTLVDNLAGLLGGIKLWDTEEPPQTAPTPVVAPSEAAVAL